MRKSTRFAYFVPTYTPKLLNHSSLQHKQASMRSDFYRIVAVFIFLFFLQARVTAQPPRSFAASEIYAQLQKLQVLGSVLYVGAHPDDENTRLIAWLSKEKKYRTAYLSLTRGDGGQNLIGDEQGVPLGLIRTQELLAARQVDGGEQFFSTAFDFGFSKNPEETFRIWDKEKILGDVVFVIRHFKPDVIITRFPEDSRAGHGHHSASAILAREAFFAAADPNRFPEHFDLGLQPWQAKRLLWNTFNFGNNNTIRPNQFKLEVGAYNAVLGSSYGEIAAHSRSQHKSQGFGVASQRGEAYEYFVPIAGDTVFTELMQGVDITWKRVGEPAIGSMLEKLLQAFDIKTPEKIVPGLLDIRSRLRNSQHESPWIVQKQKEIDQLIAACMGLYFEATTQQPFAITGDSLTINFTVINRSTVPLRQVRVQYADAMFTIDSLRSNVPQTIPLTFKVKDDFMKDQPYWLREQMTEGGFTIGTRQLLTMPRNNPNEVTVHYFFADNHPVQLQYPVQYKHTDPVKGELYEPVITVPPVIVSTSPQVVLTNVTPRVSPRLTVRYQSLSERGKLAGAIVFNNSGKQIASKPRRINLGKNQVTEETFALDTLASVKKNTEISASILLKDEAAKDEYHSNYMRLIRYDHIPTVHYFFQSKAKLVTEDIRVVGKRVGYIRGAGDNVPEALQAMGYQVVMLDEHNLVLPTLSGLDAIITGVRAYNVHDWLERKYDVLMNYVRNGGNLIVQYNTSNFISSVTSKIGPYPFTISRNRVTDEKAPVKFLLPKHQVLNYPNRITEKDFDNWVQERGIYFADKLDPQWETPLAMADKGEDEQKGSLIIARYGKGTFVYTGLVFFRQLPAGVPGAYRLMANLIALNKTPKSKR